jgi:hypothetical protein
MKCLRCEDQVDELWIDLCTSCVGDVMGEDYRR